MRQIDAARMNHLGAASVNQLVALLRGQSNVMTQQLV